MPATGYAGNGLTFGTLAGMMIADRILGRANPWTELFDPGRKAIRHGLLGLSQGEHRLPLLPDPRPVRRGGGALAAAVKRGEGKVLERNGTKVAAYRDPAGAVTLRSATCTHMGCLVALESGREDVGLPLPRIPLHAGRQGDLGAGGVAAGGSGLSLSARSPPSRC